MRLVYVLLSPTFGMHQYTADLAKRMVDASIAPTGHNAEPIEAYLEHCEDPN
ncbi:MAG: hypothetical protein H8E47_01575 [Anaerolineales bacterium]|nr:hypothetical protein [Anaerolineales bacterium]